MAHLARRLAARRRRRDAGPTPDGAARGRERAVQWLYQWELSGLDLDDVLSREHQVDLHAPDRERDAWADRARPRHRRASCAASIR